MPCDNNNADNKNKVTPSLGRLSNPEYRKLTGDSKYKTKSGFGRPFQPGYKDLRRMTDEEYWNLVKDKPRAESGTFQGENLMPAENPLTENLVIDPDPVLKSEIKPIVEITEDDVSDFIAPAYRSVYCEFINRLAAMIANGNADGQKETMPLAWDYLPSGVKNEVMKSILLSGYNAVTYKEDGWEYIKVILRYR